MILFGCAEKKQTVKVYVSEKLSRNVVFSPSVQEIKTEEISIKIEPIDALEINKISTFYSEYNGAYSFSSKRQRFSHLSDDINLTYQQRLYIKKHNAALDLLSTLTKNGTIDTEISNALMEKHFGDVVGNNGTEEKISFNFDNNYNPYFIRDKYLSVFRIIIKNETNETIKKSMSEIYFYSNNELLKPLSINQLKDFYSSNEGKILQLLRLNLPDEIFIPAQKEIVRYIAFHPINSNENVQFEIIMEKQNASFKINEIVDVQNIVKERIIFQGVQDSETESVPKKSYIIQMENGEIIFLKNNDFFLEKKSFSEIKNAFAIFENYSDISIFKKENIKSEDIKNNLILLEQVGQKRF